MPPKLRVPMPSLPSESHTRSQQQYYRNRLSRFFFTELNKGIASPYVLLATGVLVSYCGWRITVVYLQPRQERLAARRAIPRVPLESSHNVFWDLDDRRAAEQGHSVRQQVMEDTVPESMGKYAPQTDNIAEQENDMRRPQLIHTEVSELHERPTAQNPRGEVDLLVLELPEYDPKLRDDVYYRSVHYLAAEGGAAKAEVEAEKETTTTTTTPDGLTPMQQPKQKYEENEDYLQFMPQKGEEVVHGLVKCKGVTAENNCVPYAGQLEEEQDRKLMLALGPVHIVRDAAKTLVPMRFSLAKQVRIETLVVGLRGGGLPRWLSSSFPNFNVDVVESDGALVRLCRRYLGFQESSNLHLWVGDAGEYLAQTAAACRQGAEKKNATSTSGDAFMGKRYDLVLLDGIDGSGHLSSQYGRLEFVNTIRNSMSNNGVVAMTVPNKDGRFLYHVTQNWRMAFSGRPVLLIHCITSPTTILMTFQDNADRGKANVGSVNNVEEFKDLVRSHMKHYGSGRILFDLTNEVNDKNFQVLDPGRSYEMDAYLPRGHPDLVAAHKKVKKTEGWNAWVSRVAGSYLSPGQRTDMKSREPKV